MSTVAAIVVYVLLAVSTEFVLKAVFEAWCHQRPETNRLSLYLYYRATVLLVHVLLLALAFSLPLLRALSMGLLLALAGSSELITGAASAWLYGRTGRPFRPLHMLYAIVLAAAVYLLWSPALTVPGPLINLFFELRRNTPALMTLLTGRTALWLLVMFLASVPANYIIRWLVNKPEDATLPDAVVAHGIVSAVRRAALGQSAPVAAATYDASEPVSPTLRAGRIIGVLERWIVITLLVAGEIAAIGFVFAAKSIVRYPRFGEPDFAEYYLIGTLYSVVIAMALSAVL